MEKFKEKSLSVLMLTLILATVANIQWGATIKAVSQTKGPRTEDLNIYYYSNVSSAYAALKAGDIDLVGYEITADLFTDATGDPNIVVAPVEDSGMYEFDLNNNHTLANNPTLAGIPSPTHYRDFRQAITFLTPKDFIVDEICGGFATRIDQPIAAPYYGWANESMSYPNYPYEYDPDTAATTLDANFSQGTTPNPYYNASISWSARYIRTYPSWHPKAGQDLDPLEVVIRTDDIRMNLSGWIITNNLRTIGIPVNPTEGDILSIYDKVFGDWNYHLYTGGWSVGRFPPLTLFGLFHSDGAFPYGPNYVTLFNASNLPNYPYFDTLLRNCRDAQNYSAAVTFTKLAAGKHVELAANIPLWSSRSYWAWSKYLLGVVNMKGAGPENGYTFMNAYKDSHDPKYVPEIRYGLKSAPVALNQLYSSWYYDYQNLDRMNLYNNLETAPYDLSITQPSFVENWETSTWVDPADGKTKTKVTQRFRTDAYFAKPVTGAQGANVNSSHYFFTAWMIKQLGDTWWDDNFVDVHHITMVNTTTVEIYYNTLSYWNTYYAGCPLLPMDTWVQQPTLVGTASESFPGFTGPASVALANPPVWISSITIDGTPLVHGDDWNIIGGTLEILTNQSGTLNVDYWYPEDPHGYTPGNVPWQTIFEGAGMYYAVDFVPSVGGHLTLKRNPFYYMETPTLGEIDFLRNSPTGGFQVDFSDLAWVTAAHGSQGTGIPDPNWFPGADVFSLGGLIDDFDLSVVICAVQGPPSEYHDVAVIDVTPEKTVVSVGDPLQVNVTIGNQGDYNENFVVGLRAYQELVATENVTLASGENTTITLIWDTAGFDGNYTISAYAGPITPLGSECDLADNILIDGVVKVRPQTYQVPVQGQQYNLTMESNTILTQIIATKNTLHVKAEGPSGQTAYINATIPAGLNTTEIKVFINNVPLTYPPFPIITTNATHYFIYFEFNLSTHEIVLEYGPPETVITSVSSSKTIVGQGYSTLINVTIHNQGDYTKTFNVTVYADQHIIFLGDEIIVGIRNVTLASGNSTTIIFMSPPTVPKGNYTISATADNSMTNGWVFVTIPGDVDGDRDVDIFDIVKMAGVYNVEKPDPRYDPNCDIDGDGDIDIFDIVEAAGNYNKSW